MKRLTVYDKYAHAGCGGVAHKMCMERCSAGMHCETCSLEEEMLKRLAAYEDTGLEPEDINVMVECANEDDLGISYTRLRELAEADKDGRCVVLDDKTALAMLAGAYAIEHSRRCDLATFVHNFRSDNPQEISYYTATKILRAEAASVLGKEYD